MKYTINHEAAVVILTELAAAVRLCDSITLTSRQAKRAGSHVCGAVANLIGASGRHGGVEQRALMDAASALGFAPEYYADTIRVGWRG